MINFHGASGFCQHEREAKPFGFQSLKPRGLGCTAGPDPQRLGGAELPAGFGHAEDAAAGASEAAPVLPRPGHGAATWDTTPVPNQLCLRENETFLLRSGCLMGDWVAMPWTERCFRCFCPQLAATTRAWPRRGDRDRDGE